MITHEYTTILTGQRYTTNAHILPLGPPAAHLTDLYFIDDPIAQVDRNRSFASDDGTPSGSSSIRLCDFDCRKRRRIEYSCVREGEALMTFGLTVDRVQDCTVKLKDICSVYYSEPE